MAKIVSGYNKTGEDLEEERRLGYVAITRAKQQLYLYCSIIHFVNGNILKLKPLNKITGLSRKADSKICVFKTFSFERN